MKTTMKYRYTPITMVKTKIMTTPNSGNDADKLDHSYVAYGNVKWFSYSFKQFGILLETKYSTSP